VYLCNQTAGYGGIREWLGGLFEPVVTAAGDPLRQELEAGGARLKDELAAGGRELEEQLAAGGQELQAKMKMGETELVQKASDAVVLAGAGILAVYLFMRK
jgi:hypothetical protein